MKKIKRKIIAAMSAAVICTIPMTHSFPTNAAVTQYKTYMIFTVSHDSTISYFDFTLNYSSTVTANKGIATDLCKNGYFSSSIINSNRKVLHTYNGDPIGTTGDLCKTKFITPMSTNSVFDVVSRSNVTIRNASGTTLSPTSITIEAILMGDVNLDGVVDDKDAKRIIQYLGNSDAYPLTPRQYAAGDINGDGLTGKDAIEIGKYANGEISHF